MGRKRSKITNFQIAVSLVACVLAVVAIGGIYWITSQRSLRAGEEAPAYATSETYIDQSPPASSLEVLLAHAQFIVEAAELMASLMDAVDIGLQLYSASSHDEGIALFSNLIDVTDSQLDIIQALSLIETDFSAELSVQHLKMYLSEINLASRAWAIYGLNQNTTYFENAELHMRGAVEHANNFLAISELFEEYMQQRLNP